MQNKEFPSACRNPVSFEEFKSEKYLIAICSSGYSSEQVVEVLGDRKSHNFRSLPRAILLVRRISASFQYNCAKNGKGLKIGTKEADTT